MYVKKGNQFPRKQKSDSKTDNDVHLETFLKESNEEVIKTNQIMCYTKHRLSHFTLTHSMKGWKEVESSLG